jgi:hypothetical protein
MANDYHRARYYHPGLRRFLNQDDLLGGIGLIAGLNRFSYADANPIAVIDPFGLSGTLTVYSSGTKGLGEHSWISYTPDKSETTTTYGTWGNHPGGRANGVQENLEAGRSADATRTQHLDDAAEGRLFKEIQDYKVKGEDAWQYGAPCSSFAANTWNKTTGENLNPYCWIAVSNPTSLTKSITEANGGLPHAVVEGRKGKSSCEDSSSNSSGSSSNSSSGSSANSSTTPLANLLHSSGSL